MNSVAALVQISLLLTIIFDVVLLVFLYHKSSRGPIYVLFMLHFIGVLGWASSVLLVITTANTFALKLTFVFALVLAVAKYLFVDVFPENKIRKDPFYYWFLIPVGLMAVGALGDNMLFTDFTVTRGISASIVNGPLANTYALLISYLLIYPLITLFRKYRHAEEYTMKAQLKYLLIGFSLFFIIGLLTNEILPVYFHIYALNATGPIFSLILVAFTFYIITRYRFLDIRIIIQKSLQYAVLLSITIGCYLFLVGLMGYLFQRNSNTTTLVSAGITMFIGLWGTPFVERYFKKLTDPIFFKDTYDFTEAIRELTEIGNSNISLTALVQESRAALVRILRASRVEFLFASEDDRVPALKAICESSPRQVCNSIVPLHPERAPRAVQNILQQQQEMQELMVAHEAEIALPIMLEKKFLGFLLVGEKRSQEPYNNTDIDLLENFSAQIAVALEKAFLYKQVAEYSTQLEERVAERTREVLTLQEEERQMMLDISHGLQTPLTIIKNEVGKIRSLDLKHSELDLFEKQIDTVSRFIYDLLRLARLGKTNSEKHAPVDFSLLIEEIVEYFEVSAGGEDITVHSSLTSPAQVSGNTAELTDAVSNIFSNAMKYMQKDGERAIFISLTTTTDVVRLSVRDTGIGIRAEHLPHLSERFFRVGADTNTKGTGLGLAITKRIIENHNGTLTIESIFGSGSTFTIMLPLIK